MKRTKLFLLAPLALATCLATDAMAAQRAYVRSNGTDTGACGLTTPCRGFAYAMTQVDVGGEVVALDAAGYGAVTITKSVTITANPGFFAGISAATGSAITVNGAGIQVKLRSLNLNGLGATTGIDFVQGSSLTVENCVVSNFGGNGILVGAFQADAHILDTIVRGNGSNGIAVGNGAFATLNNVRTSNNVGAGLLVADVANNTTHVVVTKSEASQNFAGFYAIQTSTGLIDLSIRESSAAFNANAGFYSGTVPAIRVAVGNSSAVGNAIGFSNSGATFESYGNNVVRYNATDTAGTITPVVGQ